MLRQCSPRTAAACGEALAKSAKAPRTPAERDALRDVHGYPKGGRHELLSAAALSKFDWIDDRDLLLHLVATHHGSGRPFADPVTDDEAGGEFRYELLGLVGTLPTARQDVAAWNAELPERFWRVVRRFGWWGSAYREAAFRLADHAQSRVEQQDGTAAHSGTVLAAPARLVAGARGGHALPLPGLDGANPLGFLAALGALTACDRLSQKADTPAWLAGRVALSWGVGDSRQVPVLHLPGAPPSLAEFAELLAGPPYSAADRSQAPPALFEVSELRAGPLPRTFIDHPAAVVVSMLSDDEHPLIPSIRERCIGCGASARAALDWVTALVNDGIVDATSQLQTTRRDYLLGNIRSIIKNTTPTHLTRSLFEPWDYADSLDNQSLHWEPAEDRRHAYQWNRPAGDPTRKARGGMLGANRLALEAWPLFPSFAAGDRLATRGFRGRSVADTFWTWPLWSHPVSPAAAASLLGLPLLQGDGLRPGDLRLFGVTVAFRSRRILVGKTPNLTPATART